MNKTTTSTQNGVDQHPDAFRSDTQVDFKIDGKSEAGLGYGGEVDLLADTSADVQGRGLNASKTFIYADGNWGRFELGSNVGADGTLKVDAGTIARATGGIDGDWTYFANSGAQFLAMSALPLAYGTGYGVPNGIGGTTFVNDNLGNHTEENLNKLTYYTPRWQGLQVGLSYLPDQTNRGQGMPSLTPVTPIGPDRTDDNAGLASNIFAGGINYDNKFGDFGLAVAATGEYGKSQNNLYEDLKAWNAGAKVSYMGFSLAGSYGDWGKSESLKTDDSKKTYYWDLGAAYEYGPFGASVTYLYSSVDCGIDTTGATGGVSGGCLANGQASGQEQV